MHLETFILHQMLEMLLHLKGCLESEGVNFVLKFIYLTLFLSLSERQGKELFKDFKNLGNTSSKKKNSFGHCPNEGGGRPLPELKNTIYTFIFDGRKRCTSCPKEGEGGGGRGNSGNARKKTFFFKGGVP